MNSPTPASNTQLAHGLIRPRWTQIVPNPLRGLVLAREKNLQLAWDAKDWLYVLNRVGEYQSQSRASGPIATACIADDGSSIVALGAQGEVWWLTPDLRMMWTQTLRNRPLAGALDPFGDYLAVADVGGHLTYFDRNGKRCAEASVSRPLHHLAFVPGAPHLMGCSDLGLVTCFDLAAKCVWRDGIVANIGSLAVGVHGEPTLVACFTEGVQAYSPNGKKHSRRSFCEPVRLAALSFDGKLALLASLTNRLELVEVDGGPKCGYDLGAPPVALTLGPLGNTAAAALADGSVVGLEVLTI